MSLLPKPLGQPWAFFSLIDHYISKSGIFDNIYQKKLRSHENKSQFMGHHIVIPDDAYGWFC